METHGCVCCGGVLEWSVQLGGYMDFVGGKMTSVLGQMHSRQIHRAATTRQSLGLVASQKNFFLVVLCIFLSAPPDVEVGTSRQLETHHPGRI